MSEIVKADKGTVTYQVAGQEVILSYNIVRNYLTKGAGQVTDADLVQFISVCKFNQLNPFLNEAYLVKYGTAPAQMIVSKEALFKRADACPDYEGFQAGIIVERDGANIELEGCFKNAGDKLVGGWAKVYRGDRRFPIVAKVALSEYNTGKSLWDDKNGKQSTMIAKVAKVQALREAFPVQLGAMYTSEEAEVKDISYTDVTEQIAHEKAQFANRETISIDDDSEVDTATGEVKGATPDTIPGF